jgi:putative transposase
MSLCLVAGRQGARTDPALAGEHLPTWRAGRYPSDTTDLEWQIMAAYIPVGGTVAGRVGQRMTYPRRDIVDAIRYLDHNSAVWRALPADFPPWPTVYYYFREWNRDATLNRVHNGLREQVRLAEGRQAEPSAAILDSHRSLDRPPRPHPAGRCGPDRAAGLRTDRAVLP